MAHLKMHFGGSLIYIHSLGPISTDSGHVSYSKNFLFPFVFSPSRTSLVWSLSSLPTPLTSHAPHSSTSLVTTDLLFITAVQTALSRISIQTVECSFFSLFYFSCHNYFEIHLSSCICQYFSFLLVSQNFNQNNV